MKGPSGRTFLCAGAAHWDVIARASVNIGPGDDVPGRVVRRPGGVAANVAMGLARLKCDVKLCAVIGADDAGDQLRRQLAVAGVDCGSVLLHSGATDTYVAIEDRSGELIAAVAESPHWDELAEPFVRRAETAVSGCSGLFIDATLPDDVILKLAGIAADQGLPVVANPVSAAKARRLGVLMRDTLQVCIVANLAEARVLTGSESNDALTAALKLIECGAGAALVTNGKDRAALATPTGTATVDPPVLQGSHSVTGAGDALLATFLAIPDPYSDLQSTLFKAIGAASAHMKASQ